MSDSDLNFVLMSFRRISENLISLLDIKKR